MHNKKLIKVSIILLFLLFVPLIEKTFASHLEKPVLIMEQSSFVQGDTVMINGWIEQDDKSSNLLEIKLRNPDMDIIIFDVINTGEGGKFNYQIELQQDSEFGKYTLEASRVCVVETDIDCHFEETALDFFVIQREKIDVQPNVVKQEIPSLIVKEQKPKVLEEIGSNTDLAILFTVSIVVVAGIWIYLARNVIFKKKDEYENKEYASKEEQVYEKYHSDWTSDDTSKERETNKKDEYEFKKALQRATLPDYYSILGISKNATQDEIKQQFRRLAKEWHPDKKGGFTEKRMTEINKAYEVLSNEETKKAYDKYNNFI